MCKPYRWRTGAAKPWKTSAFVSAVKQKLKKLSEVLWREKSNKQSIYFWPFPKLAVSAIISFSIKDRHPHKTCKDINESFNCYNRLVSCFYQFLFIINEIDIDFCSAKQLMDMWLEFLMNSLRSGGYFIVFL